MPESTGVPVPVFAIVGHPNEGKSSVVATLAEDDQVRISPIPGETLVSQAYPVRWDGQEILRFVDTPGFQHPHALLAWLRARPATSTQPALEFIRSHQSDPAYTQDVELLRPISEGSGIIYVVDGSRPVRRHDLEEMEILRLLGNPRMAIINPKESGAEYLAEWKAGCGKTFNVTRVFDAWRASYAERMALLESLKAIQQDWEPALRRAILAFQTDWTRRNTRVAAVMCDLIRDAVRHTETRRVFRIEEEPEASAALTQRYRQSITRFEERAQAEIRRLFKHNIFHLDLPPHSILREDLFTEKTWQVLGLNRKQVLLAAAALGAGVGVKLDLIFAQLTFGLFTLSGAALAAAAAWYQGENMARVRLQRLNLGGVQLTIGPNQNPQFPFVLLDRLLLYYQHTINWTHARRDHPPPLESESSEADEAKRGFTAQWPQARRRVVLEFLKRLAGSHLEKRETAERACLEMLQNALAELSQANV